MKNRKEKFEYDVAISFAEEDRNAALALALAMEIVKLGKVYYYPDNLEATTGKKLGDELTAVYWERAAYAVILLSQHYFIKPNTQIELQAIRRRMELSADKIYLVPVMLEETNLDGYPDLKRLGYLKWDHEPRKIAAVMRKIFGMPIEAPLRGHSKGSIVQAVQQVVNRDQTQGQNIINKAKLNYGKRNT